MFASMRTYCSKYCRAGGIRSGRLNRAGQRSGVDETGSTGKYGIRRPI